MKTTLLMFLNLSYSLMSYFDYEDCLKLSVGCYTMETDCIISKNCSFMVTMRATQYDPANDVLTIAFHQLRPINISEKEYLISYLSIGPNKYYCNYENKRYFGKYRFKKV